MKRLLLLTLIATFLMSCKDNTIPKEDTRGITSLNSKPTLKADIDFESNPIAEEYRTVITEKYIEQDVNFASYYVITTWGCGSGCVTGVMVDVRDGIVYALPEDKEWGGNGTYIESNKESKILKTVAVAQSGLGEIEERQKYWEWHEDLKEFKFKEEKSVIVKE